jgi:acetyl esterase/lipase
VLLALGVAIAVAARQRDPSAPQAGRPEIERLTVGRGATSAEIVRRPGASPQRAVVFLHGWRLLGRAAYRDWELRLARRGFTVIVPRYQDRRGTPPEDTLENALAGFRAAVRRVPIRGGGVVVVGHSAGAALAADYAAVARREGLPRARVVLSIYPGRIIRASDDPIPQVDPALIPSTVRLVVMASPTDEIVGEGPARELFAAATSVPQDRRRFVEVSGKVAGDHFAPALGSRAARRTFWPVLDRLLRESG